MISQNYPDSTVVEYHDPVSTAVNPTKSYPSSPPPEPNRKERRRLKAVNGKVTTPQNRSRARFIPKGKNDGKT